MACTCEPCPECKGTGYVWYSIDGKYLGSSHWDDLDDCEPCELCEGEGLDVVCDECEMKYWDELND